MEFRTLPRPFYEPSAREVAARLIGHWLVRRTQAGVCGGPIVETEAYLEDDPACHAAPGPTDRNRVMFGPPGYSYVYFIYGCHFCVNAVCRPQGTGEAVLIRALEPAFGEDLMRRARAAKSSQDLTNGPGKLAQALQITRELNGADLCDPAAALFIARNPKLQEFLAERGEILITPRVGINKAASLPLRFALRGSRYVSRPHPGRERPKS